MEARKNHKLGELYLNKRRWVTLTGRYRCCYVSDQWTMEVIPPRDRLASRRLCVCLCVSVTWPAGGRAGWAACELYQRQEGGVRSIAANTRGRPTPYPAVHGRRHRRRHQAGPSDATSSPRPTETVLHRN